MLELVFLGTDSGYSEDISLFLTSEWPSKQAAPAPVWFEVKNIVGAGSSPGSDPEIYDPQYHEISYTWDFGDAANAAPTTDLNMPAGWKNSNKAYGQRVAHVFNEPGTYTVTCYACEPATRRFGTKMMSVTIQDPDEVFSGNRTIIFDPNTTGDLSAYPDAQVFTTWAEVYAARSALGLSDARILLAPDVDLVVGENDPPISTNGWSNCRIGPLEPNHANRPKIRADGRKGTDTLFRDNYERCHELMLYGLDLEGEWDAATETGRITRPVFIDKPLITDGANLLMLHRCRLNGFATHRAHLRTEAEKKFYVMCSDSAVTNWQDYGLTVGGADTADIHTAVIASSLAQHVDALSGGPKNGLYNNHGPLRDFGSRSLFISTSDLFSRNGWSTGGTLNGEAIPADQAALRINTNGDPGKSTNIDRVAVEGFIWMEEQGSTSIDVPGNHVLDKVLQVGGSRANIDNFVNVQYGGTTIRNYVGIALNLPGAGSLNTDSFFGVSNNRGNAGNGPAGVRLHNVTGIDLRSDSNADDLNMQLIEESATVFDVAIFENNLLHEPNRSGSTPQGSETIDLAAVVSGFTPRHKGPRFNFLHEAGSFTSLVSGAGGTFTVPYSQITDQQMNLNNTDTGTPTNQAYWQAIESIDRLHRIKVGDVMYHADRNEIDVSFGSAEVTVTNNSGTDWEAGGAWLLRLDRSSLLPEFDSQYDSTTQSLNITVAATDPETTTPGDTGLQAYDDFQEMERPSIGSKKGAF